ncbi:MAG: sensor histidine kinase [Opitutaceae bacterium]|nr:sensor histidine kinase [Cytophagales bacterium]
MISIFLHPFRICNLFTSSLQILSFLVFLLHSIHSYGDPQPKSFIEYQNSHIVKSIESNVYILEDKESKLTFEEVKASKLFFISPLKIPNLGVSKSTFWLKFSIKNTSELENLLLQLSYPLMDVADLYELKPDGRIIISQTGDIKPFSERKYKNSNFIFDISIPTNETEQFFLKIKASEQILVPLFISSTEPLNEINTLNDSIIGIYIGIILALFLYNGFLLFTTNDKNYLYYIIYIFFIGLTQVCLLGYASKLFWPDNVWLSTHGLYLSASIGSAAIIIFMKSFLNMERYTPRLIFIVYVIVGIYAISFIAALFDEFQLSYRIIDVNGLLITVFSLYVASRISLLGYQPARYFLLSWTVFMIGVLIFVLRNFGVLPYNDFTNYTMPTGSALEVVLLSFALADKINILKREKLESQQEVIKALEENKRLITIQNTELESKVKQRTFELESAYKNLQNTQSQLVDSEKMASLGQLTAGIAHEINNPINFVVSNITPLRRDINDILELVEKYEKISLEKGLEENLIEIRKFRKEIDVDFVKEEIDMLLNGISEGASRTSEIIRSLRNFSRVDESDLKTANINEGILSTLVLLSQQFDKITVIKNIGDIPKIDCYPGKLNQAFMNIITNAIQALHKTESARIEISTLLVNEDVLISIKDNGSGMTEEIRAKIFDPFFTTKDVGKGTGLGLSITYGIIEKHKGKIEVHSAVGMGTEFVLTLPVKRDELA